MEEGIVSFGLYGFNSRILLDECFCIDIETCLDKSYSIRTSGFNGAVPVESSVPDVR